MQIIVHTYSHTCKSGSGVSGVLRIDPLSPFYQKFNKKKGGKIRKGKGKKRPIKKEGGGGGGGRVEKKKPKPGIEHLLTTRL